MNVLRALRWVALLPIRVVLSFFDLGDFKWSESYEDRVAANEARKRVERHGTE
jgi:hypothetical protein